MNVLAGTASWTAPTLIKSIRFYPPGRTGAEARLRYGANDFPIVEVDCSCNAMLCAANAAPRVGRAPAALVFNIKALSLFTGHQIARYMLPKDVQPALP
jgi:uncharacterized protein YecE (DUF72 family)